MHKINLLFIHIFLFCFNSTLIAQEQYSAEKKEYYTPDYLVYPSLQDRLSNNDTPLKQALNMLN